MCPGATPDIVAHYVGPIHVAILEGKLDKKWQFVVDSAYPNQYSTHPDAFLTPFTRADLRDVNTRTQRDNYNYYLSQLRINIECCFGMLVNKFRVLTRSLETSSLSRAVMTFRVCCVLHNFIIDERLRTSAGHIVSKNAPNGDRLIQIPSNTESDITFAEVPRVFPGHDVETAMEGIDRLVEKESIDAESRTLDIAPTRFDMVERVEASGYIRPRPYGQRLHPYICF